MDARFDSGIETGSKVGIEFDPMLAKVIVHAPTRKEAAGRLARALENTRVQGLTTNRDFLVATLRSPEFLAGDTTTDFIDRVQPARSRTIGPEVIADAALAAALAAQHDRRAANRILPGIRSGWRNTVMPHEEVTFDCIGEEIAVEYRSQRGGDFLASVNGTSHTVSVHGREGDAIDLSIDGRRTSSTVTIQGDLFLVHGLEGEVELRKQPRFPVRGAEAIAGGLVAPMPGKVISTHVEVGNVVEPGQLLLVLEAMKMEHRVTASQHGTVTDLRVAEGDQVANGELLVVLAEDEQS